VIALVHVAAGFAGGAAFSFRNPFNPQQCERAIGAGKQALAQDEPSSGARMLLAEGLLCRGLEDDPWALDAAISLFRRTVAQEPSNFFAQLELADALRKRFPLSDEAWTALQRVEGMLPNADVGAARGELAEYVDENLAAMANSRARTLPLLPVERAALATGIISPSDMAAFLSQLALTGPDGVREAEDSLEKYVARHGDDETAALQRAEILRGTVDPSASRALYAAAAARLCSPVTPEHRECAQAKWRLEQVERTLARGGEAQIARPPPKHERRNGV
jgi:hypothetical protein